MQHLGLLKHTERYKKNEMKSSFRGDPAIKHRKFSQRGKKFKFKIIGVFKESQN